MKELGTGAENGRQADLVAKASSALRASVKVSNEIVGVMDLLAGRGMLRMGLGDLNRTAVVRTMRRDAEAVLGFIAALEAGAEVPFSGA